MIDIESELFNAIATEIRNVRSDVYITGEYVNSPPSFPCVSIVEADNQIYRNGRDSSNIENFAQLIYDVNVYSNKDKTKKSECKSLIQIIDNKMESMGFTRTVLNVIPNQADATIYRMNVRYRAIVSKNKVIYRR
jgi:hypothetical protein